MTEPRASTTPLPPDYYRSIFESEESHWWHRGMRSITAALLRDRLARRDQALLDVGCGTGGFLSWAQATGSFSRLAGTDISAEALDFTRTRVPGADLELGGAASLPFADTSFDLVTLNDVLQHIHETEVDAALAEIHRVLKPDGAFLVRTNGARRGRRDAADWRVYDARSLRSALERAGFSVSRLSYVNAVLSGWGELRGRVPRLPDEGSHGIPGPAGELATAIGSRLLELETRFLRGRDRRLPFGHTLIALATPTGGPRTGVGDFFDEESVRYDDVYEAPGAGGRVLRARLAKALELVGDGPGAALDAGMGGGRLVSELNRRGWAVSGIDISSRMVDLARRRTPGLDEALRIGNVEALPFDDGQFDVAVATGVLEYVSDLRRALGELARVLRPGGRLVISFPDYRAPYSLALLRFWYPAMRSAKRVLPTRRPAPQRQPHLLSPASLHALVEAAGFSVEAVVPIGPRPVPEALARRLEGSESHAEGLLATQLVLAARRPPSGP